MKAAKGRTEGLPGQQRGQSATGQPVGVLKAEGGATATGSRGTASGQEAPSEEVSA